VKLLEAVAEKKGCLLQVDRGSPAGGTGEDEMSAPALLLTFELARILVTAKPGRALELRQVQTREEAGGGLAPASEDEPWWRVIGSPLVRASSEEAEGGGLRAVRLQFRADDQNPRFMSLRLDSSLVRVRLERD
jgi:hypothetical protein